MLILLYSALLTVGLLLSSPWWLLRMATTERYREGLRERLGRVSESLRAYVAGVGAGRVIWIHAVSVGEVLAASRLVAELGDALGADFRVVVSTTTRTGQALARERFGAERVFYFPLDFAWAVRAYLRTLKPAALVLMESEIWPRMLHECAKEKIPVAVVNARVSDRSFKRGKKLGVLWGRALKMVSLWLAQSEEDARRLVDLGAQNVQVGGNLKYDVRAPQQSRIAQLIKEAAAGRPIVVAGSTVDDLKGKLSEESLVLWAWEREVGLGSNSLLVIAPRHPERFKYVQTLTYRFSVALASEWLSSSPEEQTGFANTAGRVDIVLLDTIGDLASVYEVANVAFIGGSLVRRGGHNPLEAARFGIPVITGSSYENFRDIVSKMLDSEGICVAPNQAGLATLMGFLLDNPVDARNIGERGRKVFEEQQGATKRAVEAIVGLVKP
jgi:3-deoxy-D-manno-octulosonic-acid transferase